VISRKIYIALENMNFFWELEEILQVADLWNNGCSLKLISKLSKRTEDEVGLMIISVNTRNQIFFDRDYDANRHSNSVDLPRHYTDNLRKFKRKYKDGYLLFNDSAVDFIWYDDRVREFEQLWNQVVHAEQIRKKLRRKSPVDIAIIAMDRCEKGFINPRKNGLEGVIDGSAIERSSKTKKNKTA
jgi:hypothetical protein